MLVRRIIACLDVDRGRVVKGHKFRDLRDVGDPASLAERYEAEGADEVVLLDVSATIEDRATMLDVVRRAAERLFIPLTVGGGVRNAADVGAALRAGADKVALNSAAVADPAVLTDAAERFGSQCVVASIDARRRQGAPRWEVYTHGGRRATGLDALEWASRCVAHGAGEILLSSIDQDGARSGYDLALTRAVTNSVTVPVIASGGAGCIEHVRAALDGGGIEAALLAGILHEGLITIRDIKAALASSGILVRPNQ